MQEMPPDEPPWGSAGSRGNPMDFCSCTGTVPLAHPPCCSQLCPYSTAPSHSLLSQCSLGKSNPREGKIKEFFFFYPFFELDEELSGMPWAKPLASSCIFPIYALNSIRKPHVLYTHQHTPNKAIFFLVLWTCRNEISVRSTSGGSGSGSVSPPSELCGASGKLHHTSTAQWMPQQGWLPSLGSIWKNTQKNMK